MMKRNSEMEYSVRLLKDENARLRRDREQLRRALNVAVQASKRWQRRARQENACSATYDDATSTNQSMAPCVDTNDTSSLLKAREDTIPSVETLPQEHASPFKPEHLDKSGLAAPLPLLSLND